MLAIFIQMIYISDSFNSLTIQLFHKEKKLMKTMLYTLLLSGTVLCADKPYQDTITTSLPKPIIPFELSYYDIRKEIKGMQRIEVEFIIDTSGNVINPIIRDTFDISLNDVVLDKLSKTKYTPALQNGKPVPIRYTLPILFK